MVTSTITFNACVEVQQNRDQEDFYAGDIEEVHKDMITELGVKVTFRLLQTRRTEHGGVVSDLDYGSFITETHAVRKLTEKDELVKSGLMVLEDIHIDAPFDSQIKDEAEYHYRGNIYTILYVDLVEVQGEIVLKVAFGKKIPQQRDVSTTYDSA